MSGNKWMSELKNKWEHTAPNIIFPDAAFYLWWKPSDLWNFLSGKLWTVALQSLQQNAQHDAEFLNPRAVTGLLATKDLVWDSTQLCKQHELVIQPGTAGQQWSVASTWLRNTVRTDPKELLWRKPLSAIKGLPLIPTFLIKKYLYVSIAKQANFKLCISWKKMWIFYLNLQEVEFWFGNITLCIPSAYTGLCTKMSVEGRRNGCSNLHSSH